MHVKTESEDSRSVTDTAKQFSYRAYEMTRAKGMVIFFKLDRRKISVHLSEADDDAFT